MQQEFTELFVFYTVSTQAHKNAKAKVCQKSRERSQIRKKYGNGIYASKSSCDHTTPKLKWAAQKSRRYEKTNKIHAEINKKQKIGINYLPHTAHSLHFFLR
jgi:hypothetical protein